MAEEGKIRVIIVDDIAETRENIRKLLQFEPDFDVVGLAKTGAEAIQVTGEYDPDVVLMDINMPDMDGITATEIIREKFPATQVVILSVQSDANYLRRAMIAGAHDFLTKPPDVTELTLAIRRAGEKAMEERQKEATTMAAVASLREAVRSGSATSGLMIPGIYDGKVIVIYSPKGGTGATTLITNLAITLHSEETPVLVVDGRLQFGDVSFFFKVKPETNIADLAGSANELDPEIVKEVLITHEPSGVKILAAPARPEQAEGVSGDQFTKVVKYLKGQFKYILIDTDSDLDDMTLAAIDIADILALVATQDITSIKNITLLIELMTALGMPKHHLGVIVNRWDKKRSNVTPEKIADVLKLPLLGWLGFEPYVTGPALDRGEPFMLDSKSSSVSKSIKRLAEGIKAKMIEIESAKVEMS